MVEGSFFVCDLLHLKQVQHYSLKDLVILIFQARVAGSQLTSDKIAQTQQILKIGPVWC